MLVMLDSVTDQSSVGKPDAVAAAVLHDAQQMAGFCRSQVARVCCSSVSYIITVFKYATTKIRNISPLHNVGYMCLASYFSEE